MVAWSSYLGRKYDIAQQNADTAAIEARARAALASAQAAGLPEANRARARLASAQADATPNAMRAASALDAARAGLANAQADQLRMGWLDSFDLSRAQIAGGLADASRARAQARLLGEQADEQAQFNALSRRSGGLGGTALPVQPPAPSGLPTVTPLEELLMERRRLGYAKGTARVPGHGSGRVDTVPAMLAPGEAVLNRAAADNLGRGLIAALNAAGAAKLGLI